jgi:branched-subunit amino acid transport protein
VTPWLVVLAVGAGSYLFRISMLVVAARRGVPPIAERIARHAVPVAFAVIATGGMVDHLDACTSSLAPLGAAALAVAAVRRTGSPNAALVVGMPSLWILAAVVPF